MRWCAAWVLLSGPALAGNWHCNAALSPDDAMFGFSDFAFHLNFSTEENQFNGYARNEKDGFFWHMSGQFTPFEDQLALIGRAYTRDADAPGGQTKTEIRAHTTVLEDEVIVMTMDLPGQAVLVRCLHERL